MKQDFIGFLALVVLSAVVGMGINQFRAKPLPLVYQPPAERMAGAVETRDTTRLPISGQGRETGKDSHTPPLSGGRENAEPIREILLDELRTLIGKPGILILDARPDLFYEAGHIPSAQNLSKKDFEKDFQRLLPKLRDASRLTGLRHAEVASATQAGHGSPLTIVVYCPHAGCDDSQIVADALARLGFGPVRIFKGGWEAWEKAGLTVEKSN